MGSRFVDVFRAEEGSWLIPDGRRGECIGLALALPFLALGARSSVGLASAVEWWPVVVGGALSGLLYVGRYRAVVLDRLPDGVSGRTVLSLGIGGTGLSVLELLHVASPIVLFVIPAGLTVLGVYSVRLVSPMHDGLRPLRRGVEPPRVADRDGRSFPAPDYRAASAFDGARRAGDSGRAGENPVVVPRASETSERADD